jgi:hypothetical protein
MTNFATFSKYYIVNFSAVGTPHLHYDPGDNFDATTAAPALDNFLKNIFNI